MDRGAWWATVHGVVKSWTQLTTAQCITGQRAAVLGSMKGISELCGLHPQLMTLLRRASGVNHRALKLNTACLLCLTIHPGMF